jgi:hypothetical protein
MGIISANDIWVAGSISLSEEEEQGNNFTQIGHTLLEHWNGKVWQLVTSPDGLAGGDNSLNGLAAISANNVWAVGYSQAVNSHANALILRWNGQKWSPMNLPAAFQSMMLHTIAAVSADNVWVFGDNETDTNGLPTASLAAHWNGQTWNTFPLLQGSPDVLNLNVVHALSASDIWGLAQESNPSEGDNQILTTRLLHWNGQHWNPVNIPPAHNNLASLTASGPKDIWLVGSASGNMPLIEHWNGQSWQSAAQKQAQPGFLNDVTIIKGKVWTAGGLYTDNSGEEFAGPLLETTC